METENPKSLDIVVGSRFYRSVSLGANNSMFGRGPDHNAPASAFMLPRRSAGLNRENGELIDVQRKGEGRILSLIHI